MIDFYIKMRQRDFDAKEWRDTLNSRKYFYNDIIQNKLLQNKNQIEVERILGEKNRKIYLENELNIQKWAYELYKNRWNRKIYYLNIDFLNSKVVKVKLKIKKYDSLF